MTDRIEIVDVPDQSRYEARTGGELAGISQYQLTPELIVFTHTEVKPEFEGQGVGSAMARFALEDIRSQGVRKVLPLCPFIKAWIARHPEFIPLVYGPPAHEGEETP